jgi:hypothetical protein
VASKGQAAAKKAGSDNGSGAGKDVRLRIVRATAKGFAGLGEEEETVDFDPRLTVLQGQNASQKSTWIYVILYGLGIVRATLSRRAHILPDGSTLLPQTKIDLVGDDGREIEVSRKGDGSPEVRERIGEDWRLWPRPVERLREMIDCDAAETKLFVTAKDEDRATMLLESLDLPGYSRADALRAAGLDGFPLPAIEDGLHPLEDIERVMDAVFDSRGVVNSKERVARASADRLLSGLPAEPPVNPAAEIALLEARVTELSGDIARHEAAAASAEREAIAAADAESGVAVERLKGTFRGEAAKLRTAFEQQKAEILAEAERSIAALKAETDAKVEAMREAAEDGIEAEEHQAEHRKIVAREKREAARKNAAGLQSGLATATEQLAALRERAKAVATDAHVRAEVARARAEAREHEARADKLTAALKELRRYATELAGKLPVPGLAVAFDEKGHRTVTMNKIPLEQLNDGALEELAGKVSLAHAAQRGTDHPYLPLILIDWLERVDADRRAKYLRELAVEGGAQVVAAVVDRGPMRALRGQEALDSADKVA